MLTYDIFCDASVTNSLRGACAGALIVKRHSQDSYMQAVIQPTGTNNSGEICAILLGVANAIAIKESTSEPCRFNIFSDSIISIRGVREWIFSWIENANKNGNNILINSSGKPVINQFYFKTIFNQIILHNLDVYFYHQDGHVNNNYARAAKDFQKVNGIPLVRLGLSSEEVSTFNNYVDGRTRDILRNFMNNKPSMEGVVFDVIANTEYENITSQMTIPSVRVMNSPIPDVQHYSFSVLNGPNIIRRYGELVHALDYPSKSRVMKYLT